MAGYGPLDRLLHRLALGVTPIARLSFDLDQGLVATDSADFAAARHVFISGLARAGTTVLMRRFHRSGAFRSLTYRDMPFVLAPRLWQKLCSFSTRQSVPVERAHGDRVMVDVDSPESLDEVFWRVFAGADYIRKDCLTPHDPEEEILRNYVRYVGAILLSESGSTKRYLSKNNNNVLRLRHIRRAFPNALILIPFRDPLEHARSLLDQHRRFTQIQTEDPFVLSYMTWLAHHEFGLGYRPFRLGEDESAARGAEDRNSIEHWLGIWCDVYGWLDRTAPTDTVFVSYEALCSDPSVWAGLAKMAGIPAEQDSDSAFRSGNRGTSVSSDPVLAKRSAALYDRLRQRERNALGRSTSRRSPPPQRAFDTMYEA